MTDYKLVPVEPTEREIEALHNAHGGNGWAYSDYGVDELLRKREELAAGVSAIKMLTAAPEPVSDPAAPVAGEPVFWTEDMERERREDDYERGFRDGRKSNPQA